MFQLRKCLRVPEEAIPAEAVDLQDTLEYMEYPEKILDRAERETRRTTIPYCKVLWSNHTELEATWEKEAVGLLIRQVHQGYARR